MAAIELGDFRITPVRDGIYHWDGGALFGVVPKALWARKIASDELNRIPLGFNCYVVETGDHTVLIETGAGDKLDARMRERMRLAPVMPTLPERIAAAGIDPERIDIVLNSHLHWDHCGGNTVLVEGGARPAFPRALYFTRRGEWEHAHAHHPRDSVSYNDLNYDPLLFAGRLNLITEDVDVIPGIRLCHAPGHNRDHMIVLASSAGRTFAFLSDLVPTVHHVTPTWVAAFDLFPLESIDNKLRWLAQAARGEWVCGFGHDSETDFATIRAEGEKFHACPYR